ncbi:hypothetical protein NDU88_007783 [Pleurodeles waltl]|uniref:Secreted protein n=1 Tax=Pleurodeles waltl TaxID=8319 RepID=A0AAV7N7B5_PLEWA|nr:hypothetical protein NDU88_007783 [Pleurodeles waltl]
MLSLLECLGWVSALRAAAPSGQRGGCNACFLHSFLGRARCLLPFACLTLLLSNPPGLHPVGASPSPLLLRISRPLSALSQCLRWRLNSRDRCWGKTRGDVSRQPKPRWVEWGEESQQSAGGGGACGEEEMSFWDG